MKRLAAKVEADFSTFHRDTDEWLASTDREEDLLQLANYDSNNLLKMSDHRPVFA